MNHGDAAPIIADGIIPASFLPHGARLLKKNNGRFLFVCLFHLGAVLGCCRAVSPGLSGHRRSSQLINFRAMPSSAIVAFPRLTRRQLLWRRHTQAIVFLQGTPSHGRLLQTVARPRTERHPISSWIPRILLPIISLLTGFFGTRPGHFHRLLWDSFTMMVLLSCVST